MFLFFLVLLVRCQLTWFEKKYDVSYKIKKNGYKN